MAGVVTDGAMQRYKSTLRGVAQTFDLIKANPHIDQTFLLASLLRDLDRILARLDGADGYQNLCQNNSMMRGVIQEEMDRQKRLIPGANVDVK